MLERERLKAVSNLRASWDKFRPGGPNECGWVEVLVNLENGNTPITKLDGLRLDVPPTNHVWNFTSGEDSRKSISYDGSVGIQRILNECNWLAEDLKATSVITAYRGKDLVEAWLNTTGGRQVGGLAGAALARSLFEFGIEGLRAGSEIADSLESAPPEESGLAVAFADGIWVTLFRVVGGEKTKMVTPRENTRNVLGNIKWLRTGASTAILADDYDLLSSFLHAGGRAGFQTTARQLQQAELNLLVTGAQATLRAYQSFRRGANAVAALRERTERLTEISRVAFIGHNPNISRLPESQR